MSEYRGLSVFAFSEFCLALRSPCLERGSWLLCLSLVRGLCPVSHGLSALHHENIPMRLCNVDPLKPYFYIVKVGFTYTLFFLFLLRNIDCMYSLEPPQ